MPELDPLAESSAPSTETPALPAQSSASLTETTAPAAGGTASPAESPAPPPRSPAAGGRAEPGPTRSHAGLAALPGPDAILFDLDGTLVDTAPTRVAAWVQAFAEFGIPVDPAALGRLIGMEGRDLARAVATSSGLAIDDQLAEAIDVRSGEVYDRLNAQPRPLPGAPELFQALARSGVRHAIVTSSRAAQVRVSVDALGLAAPPLIVDGTHVRRAKPAPDALLLGARRLGVLAAASWYVGDAVWDMEAGRAASMHPVGVTTGFAGVGDLEQAGAEAVVPGLRALLDELAARGVVARETGATADR